MKITFFLSFLTLSLLGASANVSAQQKPFFDQKDLFINGLDGINMYRIPALTVTSKGTILAICEARSGDDGDPTDLVVKRSLNLPRPKLTKKVNPHLKELGNGEKWEPMQIVAKGDGVAMMNPCVVVDGHTDMIWLCCYLIRGGLQENLKNPHGGRAMILKSSDDGLTWSQPIDITPSIGGFIAGPGVGVQLTSGRLVIPGYGQGAAQVIFSDDHGKTWQAGGKVKASTNESQTVQLADGSLMLNMRNKQGELFRHLAFSDDGGQTWHSEANDRALSDPVCQASILRYTGAVNSGPWPLLFSNPAPPNGARRRSDLTVRLSNDEGKSWPFSRRLSPSPAAYSCLATLADGNIGLLYETGEKHPSEKITFARFNLAWLTAPQ